MSLLLCSLMLMLSAQSQWHRDVELTAEDATYMPAMVQLRKQKHLL
jgi:hypothetical protein